MIDDVGTRVQELITYLNLTYNEFARNCGFTNYLTVKKIITGETDNPSMQTINKILKRYPVRQEWLLMDSGEMWKRDYFEERFNKMYHKFNKTENKLSGLAEIFETTVSAFAQATGNNRNVFSKICGGIINTISPEVRQRIIAKYPYIPYSYFD